MKRLKFLLWYTAAWIPAAALYGVMIYYQSERRSTVSGAIYGGVQSTGIAALLGLVAWSATTRLAERPRSALQLVGAHAGLALLYALAWNLMNVLSIWLFAPAEVLQQYIQNAFGWQMISGMFVYGMVAGIAHALTVARRLRREREATAKAEALRTRAELSALRAQMNPHFLFNTLHSISALVHTDPHAVENALERLAGVLRRLLDVNRAGADHIALVEEWEIVRDQLELEKLRFGDRLEVVTDIDPDALECAIPIFTLQPLVENAVRHGVGNMTRKCTIRISAHVRGETLEVEVRDDGPGAEKRAALDAPGLGLRSVRQRLLAHYGDRAGVHVESVPGQGFLVRFSLPAAAVPVTASHRVPAGAGA